MDDDYFKIDDMNLIRSTGLQRWRWPLLTLLIIPACGCLAWAGLFSFRAPGYPNSRLAKPLGVEFQQTTYCAGDQGAQSASPTLKVSQRYRAPDDLGRVEQTYTQQGWQLTGLKGTTIYIPPEPPVVFKLPWFTLTKTERIILSDVVGQQSTLIDSQIFVFVCSVSN